MRKEEREAKKGIKLVRTYSSMGGCICSIDVENMIRDLLKKKNKKLR